MKRGIRGGLRVSLSLWCRCYGLRHRHDGLGRWRGCRSGGRGRRDGRSLRGSRGCGRGRAALRNAGHRDLEGAAGHAGARHRLAGHRLCGALGEDRRPVVLARASPLGSLRGRSYGSSGGHRARLVLPRETGVTRRRLRRIQGGRRTLGGSRSRSGCSGGRNRCRRGVVLHALVPTSRRGTVYMRSRGGGLRSGCRFLSTLGAHNVDDNHDADDEKDEANDETDEKSDRRIGGFFGCGGSVRRRCYARARRGRGRHRGHAPWILQCIRRRRGTGVATRGERPFHGDHLGDGVGPGSDGECAALVRRCRRGSSRGGGLYLSLDTQGQRLKRQVRVEQLSRLGERALGVSGHDELAGVLEGELRFTLRIRVHELHVTHGCVVARHELDMLVR